MDVYAEHTTGNRGVGRGSAPPKAVAPAPPGSLGKHSEIVSSPPPDARLRDRFALQRDAALLLPGERVAKCGHDVIGSNVQILRHKDGGTFYGNLFTCGSLWVCPVCAAKITEKRRQELVASVEAWKASGGTVSLLTLTAPHRLGEPLRDLLSRFTKARRSFRKSMAYVRAAEASGLAGTVRALEVTYGANGWHVHSHEILFSRGATRPDADVLLPVWQTACIRSGFKAPNGHGLSVEDGSKAAEYASKWGAAEELTKAHVKRGKEGGRTPWDLLRDGGAGDRQAAALFVQYAGQFKGKKQLVWSKGLRDLLGLGSERTDEELAEERVEDAVVIATLTRDEWGVVVANDLRAEVLLIAREEGAAGVWRLLSMCGGGS